MPAAIIVAAGRGERARTEDSLPPKQLRILAGRPAVGWAIETLASAGCSPIVVALPSDHLAAAGQLLGAPNVAFVAGGDTRQESVWNGLEVVSSDTIVIHDGARPLASQQLVHAVVAALRHSDGAVPALPVDDTLKEVDGDRVVATVDRDRIRRVQTPQAFRSGALRAAHEAARRDGFVGTDDAQLIERYGGRVVAVDGERANIKLTRPEDFERAEGLLCR